jgi:adenine/guanine/hypoxanthine permease
MLTFDAIGTLIGVCEQAGFMRDNRLPRGKQAMVSDAIGTVAGAALGTSTVTSFIESAAGVGQGGRTGLTSLVVAGLFLLALFFSPLIAMVVSYPPITAPALTIVGAMTMQNVSKIHWKDHTESIPAFLIIIGIPLSYSIADGLALGFISYPIIKAFSGRGREISWLTYLLAIVLLVYFVLVRGQIGRSGLYCFFSGSTLGGLCPGGNSPENALMKAFPKAFPIVVSISGLGCSNVPENGTFVPNRSFE